VDLKKLFLLQNRYIPVILVLALFAMFRFYSMGELINESKNDTEIINFSGKQRMYSQRTLAMAQAYLIDKTEANKNKYLSALEEADRDRGLLLSSLKQRSCFKDEISIYISTEEFANEYKNFHLSFIKEPTKAELVELQKLSDLFLEKLDGVVALHQEHSKTRYEQIEQILLVMTVLFLLILLLAALFVFYPAAKKITEYTNLLTGKKYELERYVSLVDEHVITSSTDLDGNITYASDAFCHISKYSKSELLGKNHRIIRHPDMPLAIYDDMWQTITKNKIWKGEIRNLAKDGTDYWVKAIISPTFDDSGNKIGYSAIRQDITDKKKIEEISITDGMTGLFNRRYFNDIFPKIIDGAKRDSKSVAFLVLDVDHFKQYNDTYGHQKGDDVLIKIAKTIKDTFMRNGDACFRLGGEEFGVIFVGNDEHTAIEIANRLRQNIESLAIEHTKNSASKYVTVSIGLALKDASEVADMDELYKEADELLYKAKRIGRNVVFWGEDGVGA